MKILLIIKKEGRGAKGLGRLPFYCLTELAIIIIFINIK